jgi:hypothetical protein
MFSFFRPVDLEDVKRQQKTAHEAHLIQLELQRTETKQQNEAAEHLAAERASRAVDSYSDPDIEEPATMTNTDLSSESFGFSLNACASWDLSKLPPPHADARDWLQASTDGYRCKLCLLGPQLHSGKQVWTLNPCTNTDMTNAIRRHKESAMHKAALEAPTQTMPDVAEKLQPDDLLLIQKRMRIIYCLAKKNIALLHYRDLTETVV